MKNKEVQKYIDVMASLSCECINRRGHGSVVSNFSSPVTKYIEQLEKELELKDKALDKLINDDYVLRNCPPNTNCNSTDGGCVDCWKEWCMSNK